jgi:hypothetical protein
MSHTLRASILTGAGILPSATISSNLAAEIPMYIAASSRERPRRGTGRTSERARAMATTVKSTYRRSCGAPERRLEVVEAVAHRAERGLVVPAVDGDGASRTLDRRGGIG